ncbi:MAG: DUF721 domain-containing protein [Actinomycetota bacterium]
MSRWRKQKEDEGPKPLGEFLGQFERAVGARPTSATASVFEAWPEIAGEVLAAHVKPLRVKAEVLVVSADGPIWATQTQRLASQISDEVERTCGWRPRSIEVISSH